MKVLDYNEMVVELNKRFKGLNVVDMSEFSTDYNGLSQLWLKNASNVNYTDKDTHPLLGLDNGFYMHKDYELDVYKKFVKWCERRGWYATTENYTMQLIKK